ncbi:MAG: insulinase family protein [Pseudomonadota bacterium]|nr:insulinase family protein [Pseudomonadota bacterium]
MIGWAGLLGLVLVAAPARSADRAAPPPVAPPSPPPPPVVWVGALRDGAIPVWGVERSSLPLARVELSLDVSALTGTFSPGALDALGAVWSEAGAPEVRAELEGLGVALVVGCGAVRCWFALEAPVDVLAAALPGVSSLLREPRFSERALARWRRAARLEWRTDWLGPGLVHARALGRLTWAPAHPYRQDRARAAFAVGVTQVRAAWRTVLAQATPSVVVVGDLPSSRALPLLEGAFGSLGAAAAGLERVLPVAVPPPLPVAVGDAERHVFVHTPGANQALVTVAWAGPAPSAPDHAAYALAFRALAGGFSARLTQRLRERDGLTYRVDGSSTEEAGYGRSEVELAVDPERLPAALAALREELDVAHTDGFSEDEVAAARHQTWVEGAVETSTFAGLAQSLWLDRRDGRPPGTALIHLSMYQDVSVAEVNAAARRWLGAPRLWLVSADGGLVEPALDEARWAIDTRWSACHAVYGGRCP